ncbi:MAG: ABC transporter permease [Lachnospiraceae bacterium]|nr:ABC transporter permease [Lachnospiraceae bacterium]
MSISSLFKRKVRTILTILGVVIGTISIVVMVSLGIGLKSAMLDEMSTFADLTKVQVQQNSFWGDSSSDKDKEEKRLDDALVEELSHLEHVEQVCPTVQTSALLKFGKYICYMDLTGMTNEEIARKNFELSRGTLPNSRDELQILMGNMVLAQFYSEKDYSMPYYEKGEALDVDLMQDSVYLILDQDAYYGYATNPDGSTIHAKKYPLNCVGMMAGGLDEFKNEYSWQAICNIDALKSALQKVYKGRVIPGQPVDKKGKPYKEFFYNNINVYVDDMNNVSEVQTVIQNMGYQCYAEGEWIQSSLRELNLIEVVLGGIGAVSLIVAAIGIANTMMMSIYERTKEIGVMKVLGCRIRDIQMMFLLEAGLIGFFGGVVGLGISYGASKLINTLVAGSDMGYSYISVIPFWLTLAGLVFSTLIGMMAGFFPSRRAMKLSPLAAIRNE